MNMARRRFFPAQSTQMTLGQVVDLEVQLTPEAEAVPEAEQQPDGGCEVDEVIWVPKYFKQYDWWELPPFSPDSDQSLYTRPPNLTWEEPPWTCIGLPLGNAVCGVTWDWQWSNPAAPDGGAWSAYYEIHQQGPHLFVTLLPVFQQGGIEWESILTATARCGGEVKGTLQLRVYLELY